MVKNIILIVIIVILIIYLNHYNQVEHASFMLDQLRILQNPETLNEIDARVYSRVSAIDHHAKIDKNGRIEHITYQKPSPENGEQSCYKVDCPSWITNIICWKCL
jgi:hypothetical protein